MDFRVYRNLSSSMSIRSLFSTAGDKQIMNRINAATRIAKLRHRTDIREYPTAAVFVSIDLISGQAFGVQNDPQI